jgi:RNA polymerase sigma-70 factor (ECF subfamily)
LVGDPGTLETLVRSNYAVLCRFAEKFLPDSSLAKDVVQESFIKLWKSAKSFDSQEALKAYLYTTTRNGCLDLLRNRDRLDKKHQRATEDFEEAFDYFLADVIRAESFGSLYRFIKAMPEKMQKVVMLSYQEGLTVSEISAQLDMNLKAVKKQKYKALVALRRRFNQNGQPLLVLLAATSLLGKG